MAHSDHGIVKDKRAEDQPRDKQRAQTVHKTDLKARRRAKRRAIPSSTTTPRHRAPA